MNRFNSLGRLICQFVIYLLLATVALTLISAPLQARYDGIDLPFDSNDVGLNDFGGAAASTTAVAQVVTVTFAGTVEAGDTYTVIIDGNVASYTVNGSEIGIADIITNIVSDINTNSTVVTAVSATPSGKFTLTAKVSGTPFATTVETTNGGTNADNSANFVVTTNSQQGVGAGVGALNDGSRNITNAVMAVVQFLKKAVAILAVAWLVFAGFKLVTSAGDESIITEQKNAILWIIIGTIAILLAETAVREVFYGGGTGFAPAEALQNPDKSAVAGSNEVTGLVNWISTLFGVIAVFMMMLSGVRMIIATGDEEVIKNQKNVILWVGMGLVVVAIDRILITDVLYLTTSPVATGNSAGKVEFSQDPVAGANEIVGLINFFLGFVAAFAVLGLVYGGVQWVVGFGDEDRVKKGKELVKNATYGIAICFSAYAIISTIFRLQS